MDLKKFSTAYYNGSPLISDEHYDALTARYGEEETVGTSDTMGIKHEYRMYSLDKVYDDDKIPTGCVGKKLIKTPKIDGSAISLLYVEGWLTRGLMRGDGIYAQRDITDKVLMMETIPNEIDVGGRKQITGEVVFVGKSKNIRNQAAGSLGLKDLVEFKGKEKELDFISYSIYPGTSTYVEDMGILYKEGFKTVMSVAKGDYLTDGDVFRLEDNTDFYNLGYTYKHPRGAYANKKRADVAVKESVLLDVVWDTGATGKVTPVAILKEVIIDDAKINRLTLHNVGFIEDLDLDIGDDILITRSGGVIPKILGNITKDIYLYD